MDAPESAQNQYASFLVRLWRSGEAGSGEITGDWQGEIEHIQSGRCWQFDETDAHRLARDLALVEVCIRRAAALGDAQSSGDLQLGQQTPLVT